MIYGIDYMYTHMHIIYVLHIKSIYLYVNIMYFIYALYINIHIIHISKYIKSG